ncbi:hypothetical protein JCM10213v2_001923 [Rhodosporidiobolus nylandii]
MDNVRDLEQAEEGAVLLWMNQLAERPHVTFCTRGNTASLPLFDRYLLPSLSPRQPGCYSSPSVPKLCHPSDIHRVSRYT